MFSFGNGRVHQNFGEEGGEGGIRLKMGFEKNINWILSKLRAM